MHVRSSQQLPAVGGPVDALDFPETFKGEVAHQARHVLGSGVQMLAPAARSYACSFPTRGLSSSGAATPAARLPGARRRAGMCAAVFAPAPVPNGMQAAARQPYSTGFPPSRMDFLETLQGQAEWSWQRCSQFRPEVPGCV